MSKQEPNTEARSAARRWLDTGMAEIEAQGSMESHLARAFDAYADDQAIAHGMEVLDEEWQRITAALKAKQRDYEAMLDTALSEYDKGRVSGVLDNLAWILNGVLMDGRRQMWEEGDSV